MPGDRVRLVVPEAAQLSSTALWVAVCAARVWRRSADVIVWSAGAACRVSRRVD